jgi:molybdenum cofactor cytidylyltransferase
VTAGALIVAAGFARRFGSDKRLYRLSGGEALLITTLRTYRSAFDNVAVVIRHTDSELNRELVKAFGRAAPIIIPTENAAHGMAASIADGIRALAAWDYLFIGLGDMPFVTSATLAQLRGAMTRARRAGERRIVVPRYDGAAGHPVGFSREFYAELIALSGDRGARSVVAAHPDQVEYLDVDDTGVIADIDEPPH